MGLQGLESEMRPHPSSASIRALGTAPVAKSDPSRRSDKVGTIVAFTHSRAAGSRSRQKKSGGRFPAPAARSLPPSASENARPQYRYVSGLNGPVCDRPRYVACSGVILVSLAPTLAKWSEATFSSRCLGRV